MSSNVNEIFNFYPYEVTIQTGTYTVPVGFFALVSVFFNTSNTGSSQRTISLNGSNILYDLNSIISGSSSTYTALTYGVQSSGYAGTPYEGRFSGVGENSTNGYAFAYNMQTPNKLTFFLKAGDTLSGSGKYVINLFINTTNLSGFKFFNYCPSQTIVASSSYTIPVGKHARVLHYFLPQTYAPSSISNYPSVNTLTINGAIVSHINNKTAFEYYSYYDDKASQQVTVDYVQKNKGYEPPKPLEHFLKAGDVISGSGTWRAIVSLYDIPA